MRYRLLLFVWKLSRKFKRRQLVMCRSCQFHQEQYVSSYSGSGLFQVSVCSNNPAQLRVVEPAIARQCGEFKGGANVD